ncbi:MAG: HipA N-terminal domain-containing protein [Anaeroplasmataceae bacterium]|nr:HipA N-terminal domain-containing protein [Anaeroplasmataceae bacterium]
MKDIYRSANIYVNDVLAGKLKETETGYSFQYESEYLAYEKRTPVSLTLPLKEEKFESKILFPFFDGLIPEGWLLNVVSRNWKINQNDRFGLLLVSCKDPVGNVCVEEEIK